MNTTRGLFWVTNLPFGVSTAITVFQQYIEELLAGFQEFMSALIILLLEAKVPKRTTNVCEPCWNASRKCAEMSEVTFLGYHIGASGIKRLNLSRMCPNLEVNSKFSLSSDCWIFTRGSCGVLLIFPNLFTVSWKIISDGDSTYIQRSFWSNPNNPQDWAAAKRLSLAMQACAECYTLIFGVTLQCFLDCSVNGWPSVNQNYWQRCWLTCLLDLGAILMNWK